MRGVLFLLLLVIFAPIVSAQSDKTNRSTIYLTYGQTSANLREFNQMLSDKGLSPMRNSYSNVGFGYQTRFNDFILGLELFQNSGPKSLFNGYELDYRSTRFYLNVGYSFTEEGKFQLIHYMSIGSGFLNFQMMKDNEKPNLESFLQNPQQGFILRDGNMHRGSLNMTGFLTEIGFQMGYDLPIPGREEALQIIAKFGYSFSPFEDSWTMNDITFKNVQSGAFLRVGAGISLPDHNYFYKDASLGAHFLYGIHFTTPTTFNERLVQNDLLPFSGRPNNWGLKVMGESRGYLYGVDFYNLGLSGAANANYSHTLNSVRVYANAGRKFFEKRNLEIGALAGLGFGNIRYTLTQNNKPNFPALFEEPDYDGILRNRGMMGKPEVYFAYGIPLTKEKKFDLVLGVHAGYEVPISRFRLADLAMASYMSNPYLQFSIGIKP